MLGRRSRRVRAPAGAPTASAPTPEAATFSFMEGMNDTNYYRATAQILPGLMPNFYSYGWLRPRSAGGVSASRFAWGSGTPNVSGWRFQTTGTNTALNFACASGAGTYVAASAYTLAGGDIDKPMYVCGCHTGSALRLWVNGARVGSDVAISGYTFALSEAPGIGNRPSDNLNARQQLGVGGFGYGMGIPDDVQVAAHYAACVAAGDVVDFLGDTDRMSFKAQGAAATVTSQIGLLAWHKQGSPTLTTGVVL